MSGERLAGARTIAWFAAFVLSVWACAALESAVARASEPVKPLAVKRFTFQTTRTRTVPGLSHENWGFINEAASSTQAGGHPNGQAGGADSLTTMIEFESEQVKYEFNGSQEEEPVPTRDPRDIVVNLPLGLLGNPTALPRCPLKVVLNAEVCPASTQVGVAVVYLDHGEALEGPIVNAVPEAGQSAEFALENTHHINFVLTAHVVRTPTGYGLTVVTNSIPMVEIYKVETSFWGVPASEIHRPQRGIYCRRPFLASAEWTCESTTDGQNKKPTGEPSTDPEVPFLTMPADCSSGPGVATMKADSWEEPGAYRTASASYTAATGCNVLSFEPGIEVRPDTLLSDEPVGLNVGVSVPQVEKPDVDATPQLRDATVTLPQGLSISPGIVDGIRACEETGPEGIDMPTGRNVNGQQLLPDELGEGEERGANGEPQLAAGHCPNASVVGTAKATTPLLGVPIEGHVYLAKPGCGGPGEAPCTEQDALDGNLYKLYLELGGTGDLANAGVNIKVPGIVQANPATGQLTTKFLENPQLPFDKLEIKLNGGPRAPLDNPAQCGSATTVADFKSWAAPGAFEGVFVPGLPDATPSWFYEVTGCNGAPGFNPGFLAQMTESRAGSFQPFQLTLSRNDREQYFKGVQVHTPPGLLGMLSSVPLCAEAQANAGTCPAASKIGTSRVASGAGSHPFEIEGGVYLTGPYDGAPFGLSVATPAVAGPFNLGMVVVRARIQVDPTTSALTITTDETGPHAVPQIWMGVPLRLQRITVHIDRPNFMFNPTSCKRQQLTANVSGVGQSVAAVASPFTAGGCSNLAFKPKFTVTTSGHTSRKSGASLDVKLVFPKGAMGREANIAKVKVSLPKQLPSYLKTLQHACPSRVFESDPAACPQGSIIGIARSYTPLLPVLPAGKSACHSRACPSEPPASVMGPVYFVSHGGEEFPSLIVVLQGDGVRVDLTGSTFINEKTGITSSTFKTVPDVPVNSFELYLPEGPSHALAANGNLCKQARKLVMPTEFVAQNGAVVKQSTRIAVSGCHGQQSTNRHGARTARRQRGRRS